MLPKTVTDLTDSYVAAFDAKKSVSESVRLAHQKTAERRVSSGLGPCGFMVQVYVQIIVADIVERATYVRDKLQASVTALDLEPYPELATDLKAKFDEYLRPILMQALAGFRGVSIAMQDSRDITSMNSQAEREFHKPLAQLKADLDLFSAQHTTAMADKRRKQSASVTYNNYLTGPNSRIVIDSQDFSTNISEANRVFPAIVKVINEKIEDESVRALLIAKTNELQESIGKPTAWKTYNEWVAIAANHMQVLGTLTPLLTSYLQQSGVS